MNTDFELSDEMEMPTPCQKCNKWFDLNDGCRSDKWFPNTVICSKCGDEEDAEVEQDEEIEDLKNAMSDAEITIRDCKERLKELKVPPYYFAESILPKTALFCGRSAIDGAYVSGVYTNNDGNKISGIPVHPWSIGRIINPELKDW